MPSKTSTPNLVNNPGERLTAIWRAPGRVNLIGDHTDYNDGFVLPFAIPQGTTVTAALTDDNMFGVTSARFVEPASRQPIDSLAPNADSWTAYVEGVVWLMRGEGVRLPGLSVAIDGDLPMGAGLSSSAALTCAALCALLELTDQSWSADRIADAARRVENEYVGSPVGIMDPIVIMQATPGHAVFLDCQSRHHEQVPLDLVGQSLSLLVFDTDTRHQTAGPAYAERVVECQQAARLLNVASLRHVRGVTELDRLPDPTLRARARHVVTENGRVLEVVRSLRSGDLARVGSLMTESHSSLRDDYEVSTPELDLVVSSALEAGALGARLTGAGMGGSAIVLAREPDADAVATSVQLAFRHEGLSTPTLLNVVPAQGTRRIDAH